MGDFVSWVVFTADGNFHPSVAFVCYGYFPLSCLFMLMFTPFYGFLPLNCAFSVLVSLFHWFFHFRCVPCRWSALLLSYSISLRVFPLDYFCLAFYLICIFLLLASVLLVFCCVLVFPVVPRGCAVIGCVTIIVEGLCNTPLAVMWKHFFVADVPRSSGLSRFVNRLILIPK